MIGLFPNRLCAAGIDGVITISASRWQPFMWWPPAPFLLLSHMPSHHYFSMDADRVFLGRQITLILRSIVASDNDEMVGAAARPPMR
jgi:hypothetical protein